jgi:methionine synthase I (cobalamin-dependent)
MQGSHYYYITVMGVSSEEKEAGANIIGCCCGTTPDHISVFVS